MTVVKHGVSSSSPDRLLLDAGVVYVGYTSVGSPGTLLGATMGGNIYEVLRTIKDIRPDGSKGPVKGFRRIEDVAATLTVNLIEVTEANLLMALAGSAAASHVITGAEIDDSDYISKVALLVPVSGFDPTAKPLECVLCNCLVEGPFTLDAKPKSEGVLKLVFKAHFSDSDLTTEPFSITYPS
jgi:hypothetical protein